LLVVFLFAAVAVLPALPASAATVTVEMKDNVFAPAQINANVGDTIVFKNTGAAPHTATLKEVFDSGLVNPGAEYTLTVDASLPPDFELVCTLHQAQGMVAPMKVAGGTGTIPEEEESTPTASPTPEVPKGNPVAVWWKLTSKLPIGLRIFAPLALLLLLAFVGLAGLGYLRSLKKASET
jgi:plastocyanin